jgi:hypothetical protein
MTLGALSLSVMAGGCDRPTPGNPNICLTPAKLVEAQRQHDEQLKTAKPEEKLGIELVLQDSCIHTAAYRLAAAPDPATVVAGAAAGSCGFANRSVTLASLDGSSAYNDVEAGVKRDGEQLALYYVLAARAGHCPAP